MYNVSYQVQNMHMKLLFTIKRWRKVVFLFGLRDGFVSVGTWCFLAPLCEYFYTPLAIDGLLRALICSNLLHFHKMLPNRSVSDSLGAVKGISMF